jgi:hypothetical protein
MTVDGSFFVASVEIATVAAGGAVAAAAAAATVLFVPSASLASFVDPSSTSVVLGGSFSPNLMIGIVSKIALPKPFALLCRGLPSTFRGP